jgi:hypothetical protein
LDSLVLEVLRLDEVLSRRQEVKLSAHSGRGELYHVHVNRVVNHVLNLVRLGEEVFVGAPAKNGDRGFRVVSSINYLIS